MRVTIVGSGDAFGTAGRAHTCIRVDSAAATVLVDFGAGSIIAWNRLGFSSEDVDAVVVTHLHGDHFGGLPLLLLHCQFVAGRRRPLAVFGPPGLKARLHNLFELFFPNTVHLDWNFAWPITEIPPGGGADVAGLRLETRPVEHAPDSVATGVRLSDGVSTFAYSGDTAWTDALLELAVGADLFLVECYSGEELVPNHLNWPQLSSRLGDFKAKRVVVTHLGASAIAKMADMRAAGLTIAEDGLSFDL